MKNSVLLLALYVILYLYAKFTMPKNEYVKFDVSGTRFRLRKELFKNYQSSLFYQFLNERKNGDISLPESVIRTNIDEYYVQRSPDMFKIVILYVINGKLHVPNCICSDEIADEFQFWKIKYKKLCFHCASHHRTSEQCKLSESIYEFKIKAKNGIYQKAINVLWIFLENPHSSRLALAFLIVSMMVIVLSIINIIVSSVPELQFCPNANNNATKNGTKLIENDEDGMNSEDDFEYTTCVGTFFFNILDMVCMVWFTIELILRFVSCPSYKKFFTSTLIIIDILSILPFYLEFMVWLIENDNEPLEKARIIFTILRVFKVFRIFRVLKLARYSLSLKVLGKTIKSAKEDLWMLLVFILMALLIFSNCLYQIEKDEINSQFTSIPATFWWCIATLSAVGYGDMHPKTLSGKFVAGIACVCGVLLITFPIAILVEKFTSTYNEHTKNEKEKYRRNKFSSQLASHHQRDELHVYKL